MLLYRPHARLLPRSAFLYSSGGKIIAVRPLIIFVTLCG